MLRQRNENDLERISVNCVLLNYFLLFFPYVHRSYDYLYYGLCYYYRFLFWSVIFHYIWVGGRAINRCDLLELSGFDRSAGLWCLVLSLVLLMLQDVDSELLFQRCHVSWFYYWELHFHLIGCVFLLWR